MDSCDFGLIGLAVMGQNLVLNIERNGYNVAVYNRTGSTTDSFMRGPGAGKKIMPAYSIQEFIQSLSTPRKVMIMVKAGPAVDSVIQQLIVGLEPGDLIIDGGNSYFKDTERRYRELADMEIAFMGIGVSGGEEGALWGPSLMPGGERAAYTRIEPLLKKIAAKANGDPCVTYIGERGAGHYVKMVHNGIEYGDMQLIAEAYDILHRGLGLSALQLSDIFNRWNDGVLSSFLIEITADIFGNIDPETGKPLVEVILDKAGQKGTGRWTTKEALDIGYPTPTINAAVVERILSGLKSEREAAGNTLPIPETTFDGDRERMITDVENALYASKICSYAQGFGLLKTASVEFNYGLNPGEIARIWRAGCIIRAAFLDDVYVAFDENPELPNLLLAPFFQEAVNTRIAAWREVIRSAISLGIPTPAMSASLAYFDSYRSARLPANLIQAQRDYFGAHTYERIDRAGTFHTDWTKN